MKIFPKNGFLNKIALFSLDRIAVSSRFGASAVESISSKLNKTESPNSFQLSDDAFRSHDGEPAPIKFFFSDKKDSAGSSSTTLSVANSLSENTQEDEFEYQPNPVDVDEV